MSVYVNKLLLKMFFLASFVASAILLTTDVYAQTSPDAGMVEVAFDLPDDVDVNSFAAKGCSYIAPSLNGTELTFNCPLSQVYEVGFSYTGQSEEQTRFAPIQIRPDAGGGTPLAGVLHYVTQYASDYENGLKNYNDLPKQLQPFLVAGLKVAGLNKDQTLPVLQEPAPVKIAQTVTQAPVEEEQADTPTVVVEEEQQDAVEKPPSEVAGIDLSWDAIYGSLRLNGLELLEELQEADGLIQGRLVLDDNANKLFILSSLRNPNCNQSFTVEQLTEEKEVFFDCTEYTLNVPFELPLTGKRCQSQNATEVSCLVSNRKKSFKVALKDWKTVEIALEEGTDIYDLPLSALQPDFPISLISESLVSASADQCEPMHLELRLGAYCLNDICNDLTGGPKLIDQSGTLPSLVDAGWDIGQLPTKVKLLLINTANDVQISLGEEFVPLAPVPVEAINAMINKATQNVMVPLSVEMAGKIYKFGRTARFFTDATCEAPLSGRVLDLSNPGNQVPDVPKCSFYRIFDKSKPRSECTAIAYDKETETSSTVLDVVKCGTKRLLIYVAENESLNGLDSKSIVSALAKIANGMKDRKECAPIDIVYTADDKREILFTAEDMWFAPDENDLKSDINLRFINSNSEILRDLEWIYRKWGDTLGGLIVVADGKNARPVDMTDSPASMAWKIKDVYRRVVNFSDPKNCDIFKDIMLFDECKQGEADTFDAALTKYIDQGLEALADGNK